MRFRWKEKFLHKGGAEVELTRKQRIYAFNSVRSVHMHNSPKLCGEGRRRSDKNGARTEGVENFKPPSVAPDSLRADSPKQPLMTFSVWTDTADHDPN